MTRKKGKKEANSGALLELITPHIDEIVGNEDLLTEILLRVPAKSLIKFKCVSKSWLSLITDPKFCVSHSVRNPKVVSTIYYYCGYKLMSVSLHGHRSSPNLSFSGLGEDGTKGYIEHSCNGLIILCLWDHNRKYYTVCNLTTQKSTVVPQLGSTYNHYQFTCLAFDPAKSPYYKVVLIKHQTDSGSYKIDIYSSEKTSWQRVELPATRGYPSRQKAYWDGAIHWMDNKNTHLEFDVDKEKLTETPLPKKPMILTAQERHYFGECNGNLLLIQYRSHTVLGFRILEMKRGTRHWVVKQRVNLRPILDIHPNPGKDKFHVLNLIKGSHKNDLVLVLATTSKFLSYNLRTKAMEVLGNTSWVQFEHLVYNKYHPPYYICQFFESLFPI